MKKSYQTREHSHCEQSPLPTSIPTRDHSSRHADNGDFPTDSHRAASQTHLHRIGSVGQRFLRHFDYAFLLDRSLHLDEGAETILSPAAEAYLRHYHTQQQQYHQQSDKEQHVGGGNSIRILPALRKRTTVYGSNGRRNGLPLLPLESTVLLQDRESAPFVGLDLNPEDAEKLTRSFVVVESSDDNITRVSEGRPKEQQQPSPLHSPSWPSQRPSLIRQCSDHSIKQYARVDQHAEEATETNYAKHCVDSSLPTTTTTGNHITTVSYHWRPFPLLPRLPQLAMTASMTKDSQDSPYMINEDVQFTLLDATQQDTASATTRVMCSESTEQKEEDASQRQQEDNHMLDPIAGKRDEDSIGMGEYGDRMSKDEDINPIYSFSRRLQQNTLQPAISSSESITTTTIPNTNDNLDKDKQTLFFHSTSSPSPLAPHQNTPSTMYHHHNQPQHSQQQSQRITLLPFVSSAENHPPLQAQSSGGTSAALLSAESIPLDINNSSSSNNNNNNSTPTTNRQLPRMQRFARLEDLADLEDLTLRLPATTPNTDHGITSASFNSHNNRPSGEQFDPFEHVHERSEQGHMPIMNEQNERTRHYIGAHTTFLNSADTEGSGYIPPRLSATTGYTPHHQQRHYHDHIHADLSHPSSASRTPVHYPSSLTEEDGYTAPGSPHSFLSSPSLGYYSHPSRPPSQTGYWHDQGASSLNLIMPSSAMFVKSREPTADGEQLGFVKMMVAGQSRVWNSRLIQEMFRWEGVIANDFDDEFLQDPILSEIDPSGVVAGAATVLAASVGGGLSSNDSGSFTDDTSGQQIHQHQRRKQPQSQREYPHNQHGIRQAVVEHYASSMVLPAWARAGFEEQGLHQEILVKNICIVDTPGYSAFSNPNRAMDLVISYLGLQFQTTNEFFSRSVVSDDSLGRFLANNSTGAHSHVDACLYVIEGALSEVDILFMQRLQSWVNLIPILIPSIDGIGYQDKAQLQNDNIGKGSTNSGGPAAVVTMAEAIERGRNELIRQLKEHDVHIYGIDDISCSSVEDQRSEHVSALSSSSSPLASVESPEAHLTSPPLLILEDNSSSRSSLHEFAAPPFIFHVPPSLMDEDTGVGQLDRDVMRLDVVTTQYSSEVDENDTGIRQDIPQHRPSSAPGVQENLPGLGSLRQWVYTHHLAALRHHTTLKFLAWRRHLPTLSIQSPMESSQDSGSYRHQRKALLAPPHQHQGLQSVNTFSSDSGSGYRPTISTGTYSSPPAISVTHHFQGQNNHQSCPRTALLPTEALGDLRVHDQKRISDKMVRMLETQGQVFERILQERRAAWQKALEGMEREQRIEFLMQELRKWANEGPSQKPQQHGIDDNTDDTSQRHRKLDVQYREGSRDSEWSGVTGVGLGLDAVIGVEQPSLRDALLEPFANEVSNSVRAATAMSTDRAKTKSKSRSKRGNGYKERGGSSKKNRSTFSSTISEEHADTLHEEGDEDTDDDPLGLGLWISRMFGAVGNGLVNIIVMLGMGSVATWLYTHFLEERVTWIG